MTKLVNLTPHTINIIVGKDIVQEVLDVPSSGTIARVSQTERVLGMINGVIPVTKQKFGEVVDLPAPMEGTTYIVSRLVAEACPERRDLVIPVP